MARRHVPKNPEGDYGRPGPQLSLISGGGMPLEVFAPELTLDVLALSPTLPDTAKQSTDLGRTGLSSEAQIILKEPGSVWEDTGGGDRREPKITEIRNQVHCNMLRLGAEYSTMEHGDDNVQKLHQAMIIITETFGKPDAYVLEYLKSRVGDGTDSVSDLARKYAAARDYDSLRFFNNARNQLQGGEALKEQFSSDHLESLGEAPNDLLGLMWESIELTQELLVRFAPVSIGRKNRISSGRHIEALKDVYKNILGLKRPPSRDLIKFAWKDWYIQIIDGDDPIPLPKPSTARALQFNQLKQQIIGPSGHIS